MRAQRVLFTSADMTISELLTAACHGCIPELADDVGEGIPGNSRESTQ